MWRYTTLFLLNTVLYYINDGHTNHCPDRRDNLSPRFARRPSFIVIVRIVAFALRLFHHDELSHAFPTTRHWQAMLERRRVSHATFSGSQHALHHKAAITADAVLSPKAIAVDTAAIAFKRPISMLARTCASHVA